MANLSDTTYSVVRETVEGTTPATPALSNFDYIPGSDLTLDAKLLSSDVLKANRAMAGLGKVNFVGGGSLKTHFRRDTVIDMFLESALSGTFATNVLKAGKTDSTHTIEKKMIQAGSPLYFRYTGMQVSKFGLTVDASSNAEATFDFIGVDRTTSTSAIVGATVGAVTQGALLDGSDVGTMTIAGLTGVFQSLELSVSHDRTPRFVLGSPKSVGTSTKGFRTVKLTVKLYRDSLNPETVFIPDTPVAVSFALGSGTGNVYTFALPAVVGSVPKDEGGNDAMVTVEMTAQYDNTAQTDISITKS